MPPLTLVPWTLSITYSLLLPPTLAGSHRGPSGSSPTSWRARVLVSWLLRSCFPAILRYCDPGSWPSVNVSVNLLESVKNVYCLSWVLIVLIT